MAPTVDCNDSLKKQTGGKARNVSLSEKGHRQALAPDFFLKGPRNTLSFSCGLQGKEKVEENSTDGGCPGQEGPANAKESSLVNTLKLALEKARWTLIKD